MLSVVILHSQLISLTNTETIVRAHEEMHTQHAIFVPVKIDAPMKASAASGIAVYSSHGLTYVAVANFYGESRLFELDPSQPGLGPKQVQSFATAAAHDWEAFELPGGVVQFVAAEYDAERSLIFELGQANATLPSRATPLIGWPSCSDHDTVGLQRAAEVSH